MRLRPPSFLLAAVATLVIAPAHAGAAVLYDQTDGGGSSFISSNDYGDTHTDQVADDFTVPADQSWQISQIEALGFSHSAPAANVNLFLYGSSATLPGAQLFHALAVSASRTPGGNYTIPVTGAPSLSPGTYWVSVQQVGSTYPSNDWFWQDREVAAGNPAVYRNPGGGTSPACTNWTPLTTCGISTQLGVLFALTGTATLVTGQRTAALRLCKKRARKHHWSHKRLKKCKKKANLLPV